MVETLSNEVLRRKAAAGREEQQARVMSPARAVRLALSRAADELFELAVTVSGVQCEQLGQESMLRTVDDEMLLVVLDGPAGAVGAVAVDLSVVAGIIEQQTMGQVLTGEPKARTPTATDAALMSSLVDMVLTGVADNLGPEGGQMTAGFQFGARLESKRHLSLLVEAADFHVLRAQLDLNSGAKRGEFVLICPVQREISAPDTDTASADDEPAPRKKSFVHSALMEAEACLPVILHRQKMSLAQLSNLSIGDLVALPENALDKLELGYGLPQKLGPCQLGQHGGFRAVQLRFAVRDVADVSMPRGGLLSEENEMMFASALDADLSVELEPSVPEPAAVIEEPEMMDLSDLPGFEESPLSEAG